MNEQIKIHVLPDNEHGHTYLVSVPPHTSPAEIGKLRELFDHFIKGTGGNWIILPNSEFVVVENDPAVIAQAEELLAKIKSHLTAQKS